jgi:cation-transporting P-type ATPase 13A2
MSVICKNDFDNKYRAFVKGSPEKIYELCKSTSIPTNYQQALELYTKEGFRVIALASKPLTEITNYRKAQSI